jgi:hypothetical protein
VTAPVFALSNTARSAARNQPSASRDARTYEIRLHSRTGRLRQIVRVAERPRPVTDDEWRTLVESMAGRNASAADRAARMSRFQSKKPATYPAFRRVRVDPAGRVWVGDYHNWKLWFVFDSTALLLGGVDLPNSSQVDHPRCGGAGREIIGATQIAKIAVQAEGTTTAIQSAKWARSRSRCFPAHQARC